MDALAIPAIDWLAVLPVCSTRSSVSCFSARALRRRRRDARLGHADRLSASQPIATAARRRSEGEHVQRDLRARRLCVFFDLLFLVAGIVVVLMSMTYLEAPASRRATTTPRRFAIAGMIVMASANDLIVIFLGLEVMSISVYVLAGAWRTQLRSNEAAMKYFLLGAFATGFLLYGIAPDLRRDGLVPPRPDRGRDRPHACPRLLIAGVAMLIVGLRLQGAAVPFHMWTPDVYEGAPTTVTALMAVAVKAAGFAAFVRSSCTGFAGIHADWSDAPLGGRRAPMTVGNVLALAQQNVKRMLAYSSIAHAGYILVALVASTTAGGAAALFYLLVYSFMTLGALGVVAALGEAGEPNETLDDYAGLGFRRPLLGVTMTIFMLSLTGIPPLAGFAGKLYVFTAAIRDGYYVLAVIGVLNSAISAGYYIRVLIAMYLTPGHEAEGRVVARQPYLLTSIVVLGGADGAGRRSSRRIVDAARAPRLPRRSERRLVLASRARRSSDCRSRTTPIAREIGETVRARDGLRRARHIATPIADVTTSADAAPGRRRASSARASAA
jgi:NADH-quinone oxidoreductase subunit N